MNDIIISNSSELSTDLIDYFSTCQPQLANEIHPKIIFLGYINNINVNNNKFSFSSTVEPRYNDMSREQYKLYRYMKESLYRNSRYNDMAVKLQKNRYIG